MRRNQFVTAFLSSGRLACCHLPTSACSPTTRRLMPIAGHRIGEVWPISRYQARRCSAVMVGHRREAHRCGERIWDRRYRAQNVRTWLQHRLQQQSVVVSRRNPPPRRHVVACRRRIIDAKLTDAVSESQVSRVGRGGCICVASVRPG